MGRVENGIGLGGWENDRRGLGLKYFQFKTSGDGGCGCFALVIGNVGVCAESHERFGGVEMKVLKGEEEWGVAVVVLLVGVEMEMGDEVSDDRKSPSFGGVVQGASSVLVGMVGVGAVLMEELDHREMAAFGGEDEGCDAEGVGQVGGECVAKQEMAQSIEVAVFDGLMGGVLPFAGGVMGIGPILNEKIEHGDVTHSSGEDESRIS